jgi:hypothetical protein
MKRFILLLIPILLMVIIIFGILKLFIFQDLGKGALQVTSKPFSKVYLNGVYAGTTPLCLCEATNMIRSGDYAIKLISVDQNNLEFQDKITITKGTLTVVDRKFGKGATSEGSIISLQPLSNKKTSELLVISFPNNAEVFIDANFQGKTSFYTNSLTDSDHTLRLKKDGYKDKSIRIRTPEGFKLIAVIYQGLQTDTITPTPQPTISDTSLPTPYTQRKVSILQTPNGFLRVRQDASLEAPEVDRVATGETFDLLEENAGWSKIKLPNGTTGWVSSQYTLKQ